MEQNANSSDVHSNASASTSDTGLEDQIAGPLCYLFGVVTGVIFLAIEKKRRFVRFHAYQSVGVSVVWIVLSIGAALLGAIPVLGFVLGGLLSLALSVVGLFLWLYLMWQAYQEKEIELPWIGPWARRQMEG
ncbi:DUF4870 domain-containing protein [Salinibacter sp.]|uniref:DUF4870 domain-containing protein n=1 Tax=Salinibacter sp. TaxID=2065818 RepID=UPI002FC2D2AD